MLSIVVAAHEDRDVATADVVGTYLKAVLMDDFVLDILCNMLNTKYKKYVVL